MIHAFVLSALVLAVQVVAARPAQAQTLAECQAWLCLPAGFSVSECSAAAVAVRRRLRLNMDPLPPWASCADTFGWDTADLAWTMPVRSGCPSGYRADGGGCRRQLSNGCVVSRSPRQWATVWVWVDGVQTGQSLHHTISSGTEISRVCPPPALTCEQLGNCPEPTCPGGNGPPEQTCEDRGTCPPEPCPEGWLYDHASGHCAPQLPGIEGVG